MAEFISVIEQGKEEPPNTTTALYQAVILSIPWLSDAGGGAPCLISRGAALLVSTLFLSIRGPKYGANLTGNKARGQSR